MYNNYALTGFLVGVEYALPADAEGHEDDEEQHDEVDHVLDHLADHHHVRTEVLVDPDQLEAADVPVADHRRVGRVHAGNHAALESESEGDHEDGDGDGVAGVPLAVGEPHLE